MSAILHTNILIACDYSCDVIEQLVFPPNVLFHLFAKLPLVLETHATAAEKMSLEELIF